MLCNNHRNVNTSLAHPIAKRGIGADDEQTPVLQFEVMPIGHYHGSTLYTVVITQQDRTRQFVRLLYRTISKCWPCMRVSKSCTLTQTHTGLHADTETMLYINMSRLLHFHIIRLSSLLSLSPSRQILVPVGFRSRHNPKQSSKVLFPPA